MWLLRIYNNSIPFFSLCKVIRRFSVLTAPIQTNRVFVDARELIYLSDFTGAGLLILEWIGESALFEPDRRVEVELLHPAPILRHLFAIQFQRRRGLLREEWGVGDSRFGHARIEPPLRPDQMLRLGQQVDERPGQDLRTDHLALVGDGGGRSDPR
jgi:hypothetical protein